MTESILPFDPNPKETQEWEQMLIVFSNCDVLVLDVMDPIARHELSS